MAVTASSHACQLPLPVCKLRIKTAPASVSAFAALRRARARARSRLGGKRAGAAPPPAPPLSILEPLRPLRVTVLAADGVTVTWSGLATLSADDGGGDADGGGGGMAGRSFEVPDDGRSSPSLAPPPSVCSPSLAPLPGAHHPWPSRSLPGRRGCLCERTGSMCGWRWHLMRRRRARAGARRAWRCRSRS
jgi:hypothetical protein